MVGQKSFGIAITTTMIAFLATTSPGQAAALPESKLQEGFAFAEFIAGSSFSPDEKARISASEQHAYVEDSAKSDQAYATIHATLANIRTLAARPTDLAKEWVALRAATYFEGEAKPGDPWAAAINAHDPVIAADAGRK